MLFLKLRNELVSKPKLPSPQFVVNLSCNLMQNTYCTTDPLQIEMSGVWTAISSNQEWIDSPDVPYSDMGRSRLTIRDLIICSISRRSLHAVSSKLSSNRPGVDGCTHPQPFTDRPTMLYILFNHLFFSPTSGVLSGPSRGREGQFSAGPVTFGGPAVAQKYTRCFMKGRLFLYFIIHSNDNKFT